MNWWLPLLLVLGVGAIIAAIHYGAMRWLARQSEPEAAEEDN